MKSINGFFQDFLTKRSSDTQTVSNVGCLPVLAPDSKKLFTRFAMKSFTATNNERMTSYYKTMLGSSSLQIFALGHRLFVLLDAKQMRDNKEEIKVLRIKRHSNDPNRARALSLHFGFKNERFYVFEIIDSNVIKSIKESFDEGVNKKILLILHNSMAIDIFSPNKKYALKKNHRLLQNSSDTLNLKETAGYYFSQHGSPGIVLEHIVSFDDNGEIVHIPQKT